VLVAGDGLAACLAYLLAFLVRIAVPLPFTTDYLPAIRFEEVPHHWLELLLTQVVVLYFLGLYEVRTLLKPRAHVGLFYGAAMVQALALIAVYFFRQDLVFPRSIFVLLAGFNGSLVLGWRLVCRPLLGGYPRRRVLLIGTSAEAAEVIDTIRAQHWLGLDVVGAVSRNGATGPIAVDVPLLGTHEDLPTLCDRYDVDEVIIVSETTWQDRLLERLARWPGRRARVSVVPTPFEFLIGRRETLRLHDIPLIEVVQDAGEGADTIGKRIFDVVVGVLLLLPAFPLVTLSALAVRLSSRGPVIYRQTRVGKDGQPFVMYKLRTMHVEAERGIGPTLAVENDPRVTPLGRVLRATRLDELPQLWNVVRGDMSFVGPRPERPAFVEIYARDIDGYTERFRVRPGLTGYAQVNGEYHTSPGTKLKYDLAYIHNRSLWLDLRILSETMKVMLTRRGV